MPSVADLIFIAILCVLVFTPLSTRLLGDAGIGWHIRTGQEILTTHTIPRTDPYSSTVAGKPWFAWEWLYDAVIAYLHSVCGLNGPVWFTAIFIAGTFAALFRFLMIRGANLFVGLVLVLLAASASTIHFLARPHVVSWLMCLVWFWILDSAEKALPLSASHTRLATLWFLPPLMTLWVNIHGAFLVGFVLLTIFWISTLWTWSRLRAARIEESFQKIAAGRQLKQLSLVGVITLAASFANPYGWNLHAHIYSYLSDRFLMDHVEEFRSPNFHGVAERCFLMLLIVCVASLAIRGREIRASGLLTALFAIYAGITASRNVPIASVLLVMSVAPLLSKLPVLPDLADRMTNVEFQLKGYLWPVLAVLVALVIAVHGGRFGSDQVMAAHFDPRRMPVDAVDFLSTEQIRGPFLSPDYWGGYLIYRLYPHQMVVLDDRHDLYGSEFLKSYLQTIHVENGWGVFLKQTQPRCLVLPSSSALANMIGGTQGWRSIYADSVATVFERDLASAAPGTRKGESGDH